MDGADRHHDDLRRLVESTDWFMRLLVAARQVAAPDWVIAGGAVRNLVWGHLHGYERPTPLRDIDLAYFDPNDLREEAERDYERRLTQCAAGPWQPKNQARVHCDTSRSSAIRSPR